MYREQALENYYLIKEAEKADPGKSTLRGIRAMNPYKSMAGVIRSPSIHKAIFNYHPSDVRMSKQQRINKRKS